MTQYSDEFKAQTLVALATSKNDFQKISEESGVSIKQLRRWTQELPRVVTAIGNRQLTDSIELAIDTLIERMPARFVEGRDWAIAFGTLIDKLLLLKGMATSRTESVMRSLGDLSESEREGIVAEAERILASVATKSAEPIEDDDDESTNV
jgi:hypothetical protein